MRTQLPPKRGTAAPRFLTHVHCGQIVTNLSNCWARFYYLQIHIQQVQTDECIKWPILIVCRLRRRYLFTPAKLVLQCRLNITSWGPVPYGLRNPVRYYHPTSLRFLWPLLHQGCIGSNLKMASVLSGQFSRLLTPKVRYSFIHSGTTWEMLLCSCDWQVTKWLQNVK